MFELFPSKYIVTVIFNQGADDIRMILGLTETERIISAWKNRKAKWK